MNRLQLALLACILAVAMDTRADGSWQAALGRMPLAAAPTELNQTNCVPLMLGSFQSNDVVKALIFMPGATDEIVFFRRVNVSLPQAAPSLLDAIEALTNQTFIRVDFRPPLLILHTTEDSPDVLAVEKNKSTATKLRQRKIPVRIVLNDADWAEVHSVLGAHLDVRLRPQSNSTDGWHFYRHSFVAIGVTQWEMLETLALAGKTTFTVNWLTVDFQADRRQGPAPGFDRPAP